MIRSVLACVAIVPTMLLASMACATERVLVLEVVVNGHSTGRVGEFREREGAIFAKPSDLVEFGFVLPNGVAIDAGPIALSTLTDFHARIDEGRQVLMVDAGDAARLPTELGERTAELAIVSIPEFGALLNYDVSVTYDGGRTTGGALADARFYSPYGVLQSSALVNVAPLPGQQSFVRLETTFTRTDFGGMRRWRVGDVTTAALPWSRAVRLGGVQVASDFGLRPDLVTYPVPAISASAAVPSTVNVMVNGIQQLNQPVSAGPFAIRSLPVVTGSGEIAVTVSDALGRQSVITLPFYASAALLRPGLASYSLEIGIVRENFGQGDTRYSSWAASQSSRYGLTDWLTVESHAEASDGFGLLGGGVTMLAGTLGILNVAAAGSTGAGSSAAHAGGYMMTAGFQRTSASLSMGVTGTYATAGYRDIAAIHGSLVPKASLHATLGYQLAGSGSLGIAYNGRLFRTGGGSPSREPLAHRLAEPDVHLLTGSYSSPIAGRAAVYATGFKEIGGGDSYGVSAGINVALGRATASAAASWDSERPNWSANIFRSAQKQNEFGYRAQLSEGAVSRRSLEGEYLGSWGRVSAGADVSDGRVAGRVGARGALVLAGGDMFASDQIQDSFAVVSTGEVGGVPVLYENRLVGRTDSRGKLLIPSLLSYRNNRLAVDTTKLPPDVEVGQTWMQVRPPDHSGMTIDFDVRRVAAALLTLHDLNGEPIPLGATVSIAGAASQPIGYDGQAYVTGLKATNRAEITFPDGANCRVSFDYLPKKDEIPLIGPVRCQ